MFQVSDNFQSKNESSEGVIGSFEFDSPNPPWIDDESTPGELVCDLLIVTVVVS
jgi:hypothetical protein